MKKNYPVISKPADIAVTRVKVETSYCIGDYNRPRGYYASITPEEVVTTDSGYTMVKFSSDVAGFRCKLLEVTRKSAKAEAQADDILNNHLASFLDKIEADYGIVVDRNA